MIVKEIEMKVGVKDYDYNNTQIRNALEDMGKEIVLRASIKDVITLLDSKANVEDVNKTLSLV